MPPTPTGPPRTSVSSVKLPHGGDRLVDDTYLRRAAGDAGYRLEPDRLTQAAIRQPDQVSHWIAAAARYAATHTTHQLLTGAAQTLRDRLTGTTAGQLGGDVEALAAVCDLLADVAEDLDDALRDVGRHGIALAHLDPPPLVDDPTLTALPAALAGRQETLDASGQQPAARIHHVTGGNPLPPGRRRPRRATS